MTDISPESTNTTGPLYLRFPILFGPYGLRAGWAFLIAFALCYFFFRGTSFILQTTHLIAPHAMEHSPGPLPVFLQETTAFLVVALVAWIMSRIELRPVGVYGLGGVGKSQYLLAGIAVGLIAISLLIFILIHSGFLIIDQRLLSVSKALLYALLWIPGFLAIGLFEEYLFRGYLQYTLARGLSGLSRYLPGNLDPRAVGFWSAAILVSFGFGAVHGSNPGESPVGLLCAASASLVFCFSLWRTGSLWWAVGLHAAWDYGQSFLYGVGDSGIFVSPRLLETHPVGSPLLSGGTTGPEGSIFSLCMLGAIAGVVSFTQRRGPHSYAAQMPSPPTPPSDNPTELPAATT